MQSFEFDALSRFDPSTRNYFGYVPAETRQIKTLEYLEYPEGGRERTVCC